MLDICELIRFFVKCFKKVDPVKTVQIGNGNDQEKSIGEGNSKNIFNLLVETLSQIGNKLLNTDPL